MKYILVTILALLLAGCGKDVIIKNVYTEMEIVHPEQPTIPEVENVKVEAWNQERLAQEANKSANKDSVFYVFTPEELEKLFANIASGLSLSQQQKLVIKFYKDSIEKFNKEMKEKNAEEAKKE